MYTLLLCSICAQSPQPPNKSTDFMPTSLRSARRCIGLAAVLSLQRISPCLHLLAEGEGLLFLRLRRRETR